MINPLRYLLTRQTGITAAFYTLFAVCATLLPPFNTLGYEFSALTGIAVAFSGGYLTIVLYYRLNPPEQRRGWRSVIAAWISISFVQMTLLLIPFGVMVVAAWFVSNCSILWGALFYLLIPVCTSLFVTALGLFLAIAVPRRLVAVLYTLIVLCLLAHPILQILSQPQLYAYNHLFGMFVGFSWDEAQPAWSALLLYRLLTLAYALLLLLSSCVVSIRGYWHLQSGRFRSAVLSLVLVSASIVGCGFYFSDECGFSTTYRYLEEELGSVYCTPHFRIVYSSRSFPPGEIERVADEHEFRLAQVCVSLHTEPPGRITSFIYPDRITKRRLLGSETSQISRPWMREIHLSSDGLDAALKHEIVHAVASVFGPAPARVPMFRNYGLTEGLAMAVEWEWGNRTLHEYAAGMKAQHLLPSARDVLSTTGFFRYHASVGYVAAGSFCRWLIECRGIDLFKQCYASDDPETTYGTSLLNLDREYRGFLRTVRRRLPDSLAIRYLFSGVPLQKKICARVLTEKNRMAEREYAKQDFQSSLHLYRESEQLSPNTTAAFGIAASLYNGRDFHAAMATARMYLGDSLRRIALLPMLLTLGNASWHTGDSASADSCYSALAGENLTEGLRMRALIRLKTLRSPRSRAEIMDLLDREQFDTPRGSVIRAWTEALHRDSANTLIRYELGRFLARDTRRCDDAVSLFLSVREKDLETECLLEAGKLVFRRHPADARNIFLRALAKTSTVVQRQEIDDWLERCTRADDLIKKRRFSDGK